MASTLAGRRLTEAHRLAQARLGAQTVARLHVLWPLLDPDDLDGTFQRWLTAAVPLIQGQRSTSARLAANYLALFKTLEIGDIARVSPVLAETAPVEALTTSLLVTGPVTVKRGLSRSQPLVRALSMAEASSSSAGMRHALNGGRETIIGTVRADRQALGWARATGGKTCAFCAMLASRGPVYSKDTADFEAHDHCSCSSEPVYRDDADWPPGSSRYAEMWAEAKAADGDTTSNFRRLVEGGAPAP